MKNRANVPTLISHRTNNPMMTRRVKKRRKSIAGHSPSVRVGPSTGSGLLLRLRPAKMRSVRGSSASLIPSPSRLKARVVRSSAADGKLRNHHEVVYHDRESEIMLRSEERRVGKG